jgi:type II secretory ATPase GspE/PulE/Tfp pilus assembly ATPase PilB-like protein
MSLRLEKKCFELILESALVKKADLERLFRIVEEEDGSLTRLIVKEGLVEEKELLALYSKKSKVDIVNLKKVEVNPEVFSKVPVKFAWYYRFFPYELSGNTITIAVSTLVDVNFIDEIRFGIGMDVKITLASDKDLEAMLQKHYGVGSDTVDQILTQSSSSDKPAEQSYSIGSTDIEDIDKRSEDASVIKIVNQILLDGYKRGASDIHFEPMRGKVRLRYRIDGVMHNAATPPEMHTFISSIVSRIKIMANLNVIEKRLPQDGKARVKTQDQTLDLRVSSIPTPHGESIVIRILPSEMVKELGDLGLEPTDIKAFKELIQRPYGIIFVTGPTGSGKSTTLYAGLSSLNQEKKKLITIEDPVEYEIEGITQIQVAPHLGLTFASGLRSVLRHDPDVMMVGEVRDLETADIAIRIALTGHLILSTLHTNDAASGVTRLLDIGIEPYLISSSVIAFMAQRLVRVICPHCKEEDGDVREEVFEMIRREMQLDSRAQIKVYKGKGLR